MATTGSGAMEPAGGPPRRLQATNPRYGEKVIQGLLALCGILSVLTTTAIVISLIGPTIGFFQIVPVGDFLFGIDWTPQFEPPSFGVLAIVAGTLNVALWGMLFAVPVGLGSAIYLSEYATPRVRKTVKPVLEILAGIPTVAIGLFAASFILPEIIQRFWPGDFLGGVDKPFMALAAGLAVGLMVVPIIASISEDAMSAVPSGLREGAYAMGATKAKVATRVVLPAALSGIAASIVLAISRAVGETMIVLLAAGSTPNFTFLPNEAVQTMTAYIGVTATGDISTGSVDYESVFAVGSVLFVMTLAMNLVSIRLVRKYREVYE
ncbi:MAG TPA: phosphate ABC transporter permease subunit PstC [Solirubrobacterales bacterium]|nr:phosphate ABC transporter permease subunit PstC [Solirubrobacterales bacterium]